MSTIKTNAILDASGGNTTTINGTTPTAYNTMGKNRIINGAMEIDQRNAGSAVTVTSGGAYPVDRWIGFEDSDGVMTAQQDSSAPAGFVNSLKLTTTTADATLAAGQYVMLLQKIEGKNVSDLGWGTANAKTVTLSFWVRSSLTGTFAGSLRNSANNRSYPFTYTISSADTWEQKSITVAGDTSGTWLTTNGTGLQVAFGLGVSSTYSGTAGAWAASNLISATGAVSVIGTLNATFYITGVQLEVGSVATEFERRPYGTELALCQRYYEKSYRPSSVPGSSGVPPGFITTLTNGVVTNSTAGVYYKVVKRAIPTVTVYNAVNGTSGQVHRESDGSGITVSVQYDAETGFGRLSLGTSKEDQYLWHFTASAEL